MPTIDSQVLKDPLIKKRSDRPASDASSLGPLTNGECVALVGKRYPNKVPRERSVLQVKILSSGPGQGVFKAYSRMAYERDPCSRG